MRDDRITVLGPFDGPGASRYFVLECSVCPCERTHTVTLPVDWNLMLRYPQVVEAVMDEAFHEMRRGLDYCVREEL